MRISQTIAALLLVCGLVISAGQRASALPGDSVSVAGQIVEGDHKISVGGWGNEGTVGLFEGQLQITFHSVSEPDIVKAKFHGDQVTEIIFFESDSDTCNAAVRMRL